MSDDFKDFLALKLEHSNPSLSLTRFVNQYPLLSWAYAGFQSLQGTCEPGDRAAGAIWCVWMRQARREFIATTIGSRHDANPADPELFTVAAENAREQAFNIIYREIRSAQVI
jgi:hypothetical protein